MSFLHRSSLTITFRTKTSISYCDGLEAVPDRVPLSKADSLWPQGDINWCYSTCFGPGIVREEGTIMCTEGGGAQSEFVWRAAEGMGTSDCTVVASVQAEPQCSVAGTSRYCVTLWEIQRAAVWHCTQRRVIQLHFLPETPASLTASLLPSEAENSPWEKDKMFDFSINISISKGNCLIYFTVLHDISRGLLG